MKEETIILKPKKLTTVILLLISILFVVIGFISMEEKIFIKWGGIIFFGLGIIVFIIELLPNSSYLKLNKEGFEMRSLYRSHFIKWTEVTNFGIFYFRFNTMVAFNYTADYKKHNTGKKISELLSGYHGALSGTYGMNATKLAELMNEWKYKYENSSATTHLPPEAIS